MLPPAAGQPPTSGCGFLPPTWRKAGVEPCHPDGEEASSHFSPICSCGSIKLISLNSSPSSLPFLLLMCLQPATILPPSNHPPTQPAPHPALCWCRILFVNLLLSHTLASRAVLSWHAPPLHLKVSRGGELSSLTTQMKTPFS